EKARRERKRITVSGIVEYFWHPDARHLLLPLAGILYFHDTHTGTTEQLTPDDDFVTDARFSPDGQYISYVKSKDLFVLGLNEKGGTDEIRLTHDGSDTVSNGLAEFIAQEEMHRFEGYWWSPDSRHLAFTRVDESSIQPSQRYEINAGSFEVFSQRYPYAGTANARVELGVASIGSGITWITLPSNSETYLARIDWYSDSERLAVQLESRDQKSLTLYACSRDNSRHAEVLTETSDTWINLVDSFRSIPGEGFLWGSERSGFGHLYLVSEDGKQVTPLTSGDWVVTRVLAVDEVNRLVYFEGRKDTPLENHLYATPIDGGQTTRLTTSGYSHQVELSRDCAYFIDKYSAALPDLTAPSVAVVKIPNSTAGNASSRPIFSNHLDTGHPIHPYLDSFGKVSLGTLAASDGAILHYRLIKPARLAEDAACPVIVTVYGGPGVQRVTNEWIPPWHHYMAARGYALFQLDNRGSANRGRAFEAPIHMTLGVSEVEDQLLGIEFLETLSFIDPTRIGVFGHSYGGYLTLMLMAKAADKFRAGISVAPVSDWLLYDTHYTERFLGMPDTNPQGYHQSSVFPYLHKITGELLLIHGMADDNVLFTHSTRLYQALQDANIPFEMMNYPGAKHGISGRKTNIHRFGIMDRFFDRHLKGTL
ncbi:MAG: S9 family peptidase, partial [Pseudomonadales bacterium]